MLLDQLELILPGRRMEQAFDVAQMPDAMGGSQLAGGFHIDRGMFGSQLVEAHAVLGICAMSDWDWPLAERKYQEALRINPNYATARHWHAILLLYQCRYDESLAEIRLAHSLDPLSGVIQCLTGFILHLAGRDDEGLAEIDKALKFYPDFPLGHLNRGDIFSAQKKFPEAIAEYEIVRQHAGDSFYGLSGLGYAYARAGRTNEARQILEQLKNFSTSGSSVFGDISLVYEGLGDLDNAFIWLDRAAQAREVDPRALKSEPLSADLAKDPRYAALLKKYGLDK